MIQAQHFSILLESSYPANRAHLLSVAAPHASSCLLVVPSPGLGLHLESNEYQMAIRWWLGVHVQQLVSSLEADDECAEILLQASYLDDGALAGTHPAVLHALHLVEKLGPALGLHVNLAKCELFSRRGNTSFPLEDSPIPQKVLSGMIQAQHFQILLQSSSPANRAHLLSVAAPHASSWLSVVPSPGLSLHLESNEYQMAIRWWLWLDTSGWSMCPDTALDPLGHHAVTCRHGGDVVIRHNRLRDEVFNLCRRAHLSVSVERGHGLTRDLAHTRPADILIAGWDRGKPVALDLTITSPLCSAILRATAAFYLAIHQSSAKSAVVAEIYGWFNMALVRSIARAILARELLLS
eukprot:Em0003g628a